MIYAETADAHSGRLNNSFDQDKVQRELDLQRDVSLSFSRNVGAARAEINRHLDTLKEKLEKGEIGREDYQAQTRNWQRGQILLNSIATGLSAPTQSGTGIAAATASPALSYQIGQYFKGKAQQNPDGRLTAQQETAHILAHAVLGAATAAAGENNALTGAIGAGGAEAAAPYVSKWLYGEKDGSKLTAAQKETVSSILSLGAAVGTHGGSTADTVAGNQAAKGAVENNSLHIDINGIVIRNTPNNDYNIYQYNYTCSPVTGNNCPNLTEFNKLKKISKKTVGQIMWQDSFTSPESGKSFGIIHFGESIEPYIYQLNNKAWGQSDIIVGWKSRSGGEYDIKNNYPSAGSYHGFLFQGKYITLRDAGNILAGMNAAVNGKLFDDFQKASGALQQGGIPAVINNRMTGKTYGPAPMYGELPYQYHKSKYGYDLGLYRLRMKNYINNATPNNVPTIGDIFNEIH